MRGHFGVGDSVTTNVAITVGVGKHNGEKRMTLELKIYNLKV